MYFAVRVSRSGAKCPAWPARQALLTPSAATMTSASASPCRASPASSRTSVWKRSVTPDLLAASLQDLEQLLARDAREAVPARGDDPIAHVDVDVVPVGQRGRDPGEGVGVGGAEVDHRLVGEHHAPAEGVVAAVALEHGDVGVGTGLLEQQGDVQPGRAAADDRDLHRELPAEKPLADARMLAEVYAKVAS